MQEKQSILSIEKVNEWIIKWISMNLFSQIIQITYESKSPLLILCIWNSSREILIQICHICLP